MGIPSFDCGTNYVSKSGVDGFRCRLRVELVGSGGPDEASIAFLEENT